MTNPSVSGSGKSGNFSVAAVLEGYQWDHSSAWVGAVLVVEDSAGVVQEVGAHLGVDTGVE